MKKFCLLLFLYAGILYSNNSAWLTAAPDSVKQNVEIKDSWFSPDKGMHLAGSFIATGLVTLSSKRLYEIHKPDSRLIAVSFSLSLGVGKELYDSQQEKNHFSGKDLAADVLGILIAVLVFK